MAPETLSKPVGVPGAPPGQGALLGVDALGRDVFSRVLYGGRSVIGLAALATALAFAAGMTIGLIAGYSRSLIDPILMRAVDVALAFPAMLILLLLAGGLGTSTLVVVLGVVLVESPPISRVIRTATLEVSTRGYVEAAVARGDGTFRVVTRQILPNVTPVALAALGTFFGYSVILIASMNFLGLGLKAPAADWGLMMAENRGVLELNPASVLAPAAMLALLTISINLVADAYSGSQGVGTRADKRRRTRTSARMTNVGTSTAADLDSRDDDVR